MGKKGGLNVGAVLILPDGFSLAPKERIPEEMKTKVGKLYFQPYTPEKEKYSCRWSSAREKIQ